MKTIVAALLFGFVAFSAAEYSARLRSNPVKPGYAHVSPPAVVHEEPAEEEPVVYKPLVKTVHKVPARVASTDYNTNDEERHQHEDEQAKNAKYSFGSAIDDGIQDSSHIRQETRDGLRVEGSYAYSDGYFKRVVNYVADENGYRVVSESEEPISETGPNIDLVNGKAEIHTQIGGVDNQYSVSAHEIPALRNLSTKH